MRTLAYVLGGLMFIEGLWGLLSPRSWFAIYPKYVKPLLPNGIQRFYDRAYRDYAQLSAPSIRYLGAWTLFMGLFTLLLAGYRAPSAVARET